MFFIVLLTFLFSNYMHSVEISEKIHKDIWMEIMNHIAEQYPNNEASQDLLLAHSDTSISPATLAQALRNGPLFDALCTPGYEISLSEVQYNICLINKFFYRTLYPCVKKKEEIFQLMNGSATPKVSFKNVPFKEGTYSDFRVVYIPKGKKFEDKSVFQCGVTTAGDTGCRIWVHLENELLKQESASVCTLKKEDFIFKRNNVSYFRFIVLARLFDRISALPLMSFSVDQQAHLSKIILALFASYVRSLRHFSVCCIYKAEVDEITLSELRSYTQTAPAVICIAECNNSMSFTFFCRNMQEMVPCLKFLHIMFRKKVHSLKTDADDEEFLRAELAKQKEQGLLMA